MDIARSAHAAGSDTIRVALIGCGWRGRGAVCDCLSADPGTRVSALADAFEDDARTAADVLRLDDNFKSRIELPPDRLFSGFDAYLKAIHSGVDLVILATPPGFRPLHYQAAVEAGKHVFMEKPCCVDAPGFRSLLETNRLANRKGLKVAVGLQRRHDPRYRETVLRIQDGALGQLCYLQAWSNGGRLCGRRRQSGQNEMQHQMRNWRHFVWLSGDTICEQHVHNLDVANWVMKDQHPIEANGMGGRQLGSGGEHWEPGHVFDHHFIEFTYADGTRLYSQCRQTDHCWSRVAERAVGSQGSSNCCGWIDGRNAWHYAGPGVNPYLQEHVNLIAAIRNSQKLNDGWHAAYSSMTAVLGRMASYSGQVVKWDEAVVRGRSEILPRLAWDADPPIMPDANGRNQRNLSLSR